MKDLQARFFDLEAHQFEDGTVRLSQQSGIDDPSIIDLHPQQLRHLAEQCGFLQPNPTPKWPRGFICRLNRVRAQAEYTADLISSIPCFPPQGEPSDEEREAQRLVEMIDDLLIDFGLPLDPDPEQEPAEVPKPAQKSDDIYQQDLELGGAS